MIRLWPPAVYAREGKAVIEKVDTGIGIPESVSQMTTWNYVYE